MLQVTHNGYMGFGLPKFLRLSPQRWANFPSFATRDDFSVLAPHWTKCAYDSVGGTTPVYLQVYERPGDGATSAES